MPLPPHIHSAVFEIVARLKSHSTSSSPKRVYSELFQDLPDKKLYADYYQLIKEPRALNDVLASLNKGNYSSPVAVAYDLFLIWNNAREYNQEGSVVYADADKLETCMQDLWNGRVPPLPPFHKLLRPGSLPSQPTVEKSAKRSFKLTNSHQDSPENGASSNGSSSKHKDKEERRRIKEQMRQAAAQAAPPVASTSTSAPPLASVTGGAPTSVGGFKFKIAPKLNPTPPSNSAPAPYAPTPLPAPIPPAPRVRKPKPAAIPAAPVIPSYNPSNTIAPSAMIKAEPSVQHNNHVAAVAAPSVSSGIPPSSTAAGPAPPIPITALSIPSAASVLKQESRKVRRAREKAAKDALRAVAGPSSSAVATTSRPEPMLVQDTEALWMEIRADINKTSVYKWVMHELRNFKDDKGRLRAVTLYSLPDAATRQDYYDIVKEPVAFEVIDYRIKANLYATPEHFDRDLSHLFDVAKIFIKPDSGHFWEDLMLVQRRYHELTKPGASPQTLAAYEKTEDKASLAISDRTNLSEAHFKGQVIKVGDWVHLLNPDNPAKPIVAHVFKIYKKTDSSQRYLSVCWYYRPEETVHPVTRQFYEMEVFKSAHFVDHPLEDFLERCFVMFHSRYIRGRPAAPLWTPQMPLYVCEHRYKEEAKVFKKIKIWESCLPEIVKKADYPLVENVGGAIEVLRKVKSPFVLGGAGTGGIGGTVRGGVKATPVAAPAAGGTRSQRNAPPTPAAVPAAVGVKIHHPAGGPNNLTPSQMAVTSQKFDDVLPRSLQRKFQCDPVSGDLLWFSAPPIVHAGAGMGPGAKRRKVVRGGNGHTLEYLLWKAERLGQQIQSVSLHPASHEDAAMYS